MISLTELYALADAVGVSDVRFVVSDVGHGYGYADLDAATCVIGHQESRGDYIGVALHEMAHCVLCPRPLQTAGPVVQREKADEVLNAIPNRQGLMQRICPWFMHGKEFIRLCLHLQYRAVAAGFECSWTDLRCAGQQYELSPVWMYGNRLADEPSRLSHLPLTDVLETPEPKEFTELFETDTTNWKRNS